MTCRPLHAVALLACAVALHLAAPPPTDAQTTGPGPCRQGVLALIVMIDAEEHDKTHYRTTAKSVVETCGTPGEAKKLSGQPTPFDKQACGKLVLAMLDSIEDNKLGAPQFAQVRDEFAGKCVGG